MNANGARRRLKRERQFIPGVVAAGLLAGMSAPAQDSHDHIVQLSLRPGHDMREIESAFSIPALQQVTRARASTLPAGEWITAVGGWVPNQFVERRLPTRRELDAAAPNHAVYLRTGFARPAVTNSKGEAFFSQHGVIVGADGGIGANAQTVAAWKALTSLQTDTDRRRGALDAMRYAARVGLTSSADKGVAWPADTPGAEGIAQLGAGAANEVPPFTAYDLHSVLTIVGGTVVFGSLTRAGAGPIVAVH